MRTRLIRPIFWSDAKVAALPIPARLTFMGLWGLCDDDGYFDWRPDEIAAELYRYAPVRGRVRAVTGHLARLVSGGCIQQLDCGRHGLIASMPKHRIQGGRMSYPTRENHLGTCIAGRVHARRDASVPVLVSDTDTGSVRIGSVMGAPPRANGESPLDAVALTVGGPVAAFARGKVEYRPAPKPSRRAL